MRLTADGLSLRFPQGAWLFEDLSFTLLPGRVYAVTGPSGSGKSSLLNMLAGWLQPTTGTIVHEDVAFISWVFQNPHGVARRTALDHVALPYLARGADHARARQCARVDLDTVGLATLGLRQFRHLSGGEAQRLMLARALATRPQLLLVDEPTAQLDQRTAVSVNQAIGSISSSGTIVVVATHDERTRDACTDEITLGAAR